MLFKAGFLKAQAGAPSFDFASYLVGAGDNEGWYSTDASATMYQELPGGGTTAAGDGDVVGTVLNADGGGVSLSADSTAARPDRNNTQGLLDWNTTAKRAMKVTTTTRGSDMYYACVMSTTQSPTVYVLEGNATVLFVLATSGSGSSPFSNIGTPTIFVDGVALVSPTRGTLYSAIADGNKHVVEIVGADMTQANWSVTYFGGKSTNYLGLSGDYFISENLSVTDREAVGGALAARHSLTYAGVTLGYTFVQKVSDTNIGSGGSKGFTLDLTGIAEGTELIFCYSSRRGGYGAPTLTLEGNTQTTDRINADVGDSTVTAIGRITVDATAANNASASLTVAETAFSDPTIWFFEPTGGSLGTPVTDLDSNGTGTSPLATSVSETAGGLTFSVTGGVTGTAAGCSFSGATEYAEVAEGNTGNQIRSVAADTPGSSGTRNTSYTHDYSSGGCAMPTVHYPPA